MIGLHPPVSLLEYDRMPFLKPVGIDYMRHQNWPLLGFVLAAPSDRWSP